MLPLFSPIQYRKHHGDHAAHFIIDVIRSADGNHPCAFFQRIHKVQRQLAPAFIKHNHRRRTFPSDPGSFRIQMKRCPKPLLPETVVRQWLTSVPLPMCHPRGKSAHAACITARFIRLLTNQCRNRWGATAGRWVLRPMGISDNPYRF